jgi:adenylate kinase
MANMLIMGPAGAGKGTMSERIEAYCHIPHISSGDMFHAEMSADSDLGRQAKEYVSTGRLVPDELTIAMVAKRLAADDCQRGYLLDGFPRTLNQAEACDAAVAKLGRPIQLVINLNIDQEVLIERIENRRICSQCKTIYNLVTKAPKKAGICDVCGAPLYQREDDNREKLQTRLQAYERDTRPALAHYQSLGLLRDVDAAQDIDKVWEAVKNILDETFQNNGGF